jgi:hypothetical protein
MAMAAPLGPISRSRRGSPRFPSTRGPQPRRSPAATRSAPRSARTGRWAPRRWRRRRLSGSPSGPPGPCPSPRPAPRSTRPASPAWSRPARRGRTARTGTGSRPAPRRTHAARPAPPVDHHVRSRRPQGRAAPPVMITAARLLRLGDQPPEVPVRPANPAPRTAGSSRFAEIRPAVFSTRSATSTATPS